MIFSFHDVNGENLRKKGSGHKDVIHDRNHSPSTNNKDKLMPIKPSMDHRDGKKNHHRDEEKHGSKDRHRSSSSSKKNKHQQQKKKHNNKKKHMKDKHSNKKNHRSQH